MKIAVLADLHLTDNFKTVKIPVLEWALQEVLKQQCDCICCIGDLTAQGSDRQTGEILKYLNALPVKWCSTPGNAEVRIYRDGRNAARFDVPAPENVPVVLIDTTFNEPSATELAKLSALPDNGGFLLATHNPVRNWSKEAQSVFEQAVKRGAVTFDIAGHSHHDDANILRGLDPDKAAGGAPMFAVLTQEGDKSWSRQDLVMPNVCIAQWSAAEREDFKQNIGFTTMWEEVAALEFAAQHRVKNVELRIALTDDFNEKALLNALDKWRKHGGEILSLHLPDLHLDDDGAVLRQYVEFAQSIHCDRVTLHVPRVTAAEFASAKDVLLEKFADIMQGLLENNVVIGIENLHTSSGKDTFETRNFGCTIEECRLWIELLREKFSTDKIGFHLDVGHARNNAPISGRENLSDWYVEMGDLLNGWHLHQVEHKEGKFFNHRPLTGFYDKLIVLTGLFMAQRAGQLKKAPMFLESRTWEGNVEAYTKLTGQI